MTDVSASETARAEREVEEALREFRSQVVPVDGPEVALARRNRTVSHLRALQARAVVRGQDARSWRKRLMVAALVLFPTGAMATTWAVLQEPAGQVSRSEEERPASVRRAAPDGKSRAPLAPSVVPLAAPIVHASDPSVVVQAPGSVAPAVRPGPTSAGERRAAVAAGAAGVQRTSPVIYSGSVGYLPDRSTLAAENALMQAAMGSARVGDDQRAVALFGEFLARYPRSPLSESASVERVRALGRVRGDRLEPLRGDLGEHGP